MQRSKLFSIISIVCFCSIILIPIGLALMWFSTNWKKLWKIIISTSLCVLYAVLIVVFLLLVPSINSKGAALPFNYSKGQTEFNTNVPSNGKEIDEIKDEFKTESRKDSDKKKEPAKTDRLPKSLKREKGNGSGRFIFPLLFFIVIIIFIIIQNIRAGRKKQVYENPYVDTNQYKLPLADDAKMPLVHFLKARFKLGEKLYFASETNQNKNEGNIVVTDQRIIIMNPEVGEIDFPYEVLEAVSSVSNSVIMITAGTKKYYVFLPETQVKYALAVIRWGYKKHMEGEN